MFDRFAHYFLMVIGKIIQTLPLCCYAALARTIAVLAYLLDRRRFVAYANLKAAFPGRYSSRQIKSIIRRYYLHFSRVLLEMLYFPKMNQDYVERYIKVEGYDCYMEAVQQKSGAMFMTAHFGNWELMQIWSGILGHPLHILAREQKYNRLNSFLNDLRSSHGARPIFTRGMEIRELIRALKQGELVGVLGDQGGGREGTIVRFFGRKTTTPAGVIAIAQRTKAKVIPCFSVRQKGLYHTLHFTSPLELVDTGDEQKDDCENCHRYLERLEKFIAQHPEQWLWGHKRWKFCFTKRVVVLEDEKAGHATQARAIALELKTLLSELSSEYEVDIQPVKVCFRNRFCRTLFSVLAFFLRPFAQSRLSLLSWFLKPESARVLQELPYADFIVSCGAKLVPLNLWLVCEHLAKSVVVMKPPFPYSLLHYDLVIFPKHDQATHLRSSYVKTMMAPNLVSDELLRKAGEQLRTHTSLSKKRIVSIFIGGNTRDYEFDKIFCNHWCRTLKLAAEELDFDFLITTSRRTSQEVSDLLKASFENDPRCKLLVIANEKNIENVIYGMLSVSELAVVTEDSVSMISEALSAFKRVVVLRLSDRGLPKKHRKFQEILAEENLIHMAAPRDFQIKLEAASRLKPPIDFIREEKREIREVIRRLL